MRIRTIALAATAAFLLAGAARAQEGLIGKINLATTKGVEEVKGEWRYADVTTGVGPDKNEIEPKAHGAFDDEGAVDDLPAQILCERERVRERALRVDAAHALRHGERGGLLARIEAERRGHPDPDGSDELQGQ